MDQSHRRSLLTFFLLVFTLSIPFILIGASTPIQLLPGIPVSGLMFVCPASAALIIVYKENRARGVKELLKRSFDFRRIRAMIWYAPVFLLMPGISVLAYGLMRLMEFPLPSFHIPFLSAVLILPVFFIAALGEELGWSGYAIDPMQARTSSLTAAIVLGLTWAAWHIFPLVQAHRAPSWIAWWSFYTVGLRIILTWIYNNTGKSVFAAAVFHAVSNLSWQLFPNNGSHWDPRITGLIVAFVAAIITAVWGPQKLARRE